ncbi:MAG: TRAP transporter substrate-binding protein [Mesorhizobium sp.]|nr:TRAP transporter substrate-binding protein [Mesorhizobium sp.]MCO5162239.1 TRAP transporter substrate-binding protein [Mesorhizobium sp.]
MKKISLAAFAIGLLSSGQVSAQDITLKFSVFTPEQEITYQQAMLPWARAVEEASGGKVKIQMFPGGTLGRDGSKQIKMLKDGVADIAFIIPAYNPGLFPDNWVTELPATSNSALEGSVAFWRMLQDGKLRGYDDLEVISTFVTSPYLVHSTKPISSIEDIKGLKMRTAGPLEQGCVELLGGVPVGMPIGKAAESLARGVVEGIALHYPALFAFGVADATPYHYHNAFGSIPFGFVMDKAKFEALPEEVRDIMHEKGGEALARIFGAAMDAEGEKRLAQVQADPKQSVVIPSEEDRAKWGEAMSNCSATYVAAQDRGGDLQTTWVEALGKLRAN